MKILFIVNVDWFFVSHRLPLAKEALKRGDEVWIITKDTGYKTLLEEIGAHVIDFPFERSGTNPLHEVLCVLGLRKLYKRIKPDVVHNITLKASLLSSLAAKLAGYKSVVNAISGFGYTFSRENVTLLQRLVVCFIKLAFKSNYFSFIFQNPDDKAMFGKLNLVGDDQIFLIKGSGVDLNVYDYTALNETEHKIKFLLPARMLRDKGVMEFINAAMLLRDKLEGRALFILAGMCDDKNKAGITEKELKTKLISGYIEWIGYQKDMIPVYKNSDVVVLPSYREGLPKSLIEACAIGRPIITTDVPGCRECVVHDKNGLLVPARTVQPLADAILKLVDAKEIRVKFGQESRKMAERDFSIEKVVEKHFDIYKKINNVFVTG